MPCEKRVWGHASWRKHAIIHYWCLPQPEMGQAGWLAVSCWHFMSVSSSSAGLTNLVWKITETLVLNCAFFFEQCNITAVYSLHIRLGTRNTLELTSVITHVGQVFGTAVKMMTGMPTSGVRLKCLGLSLGSAPNSSCWLMHTQGSNGWWWFKYSGPCHPHGRSRLQSHFLACPQAMVGNWENEPVNRSMSPYCLVSLRFE